MIIGKVVSRVVATEKLEPFTGRQLLSVEPLEGFGDPRAPIIAIDTVQAGPGDIVLVLQEGSGARQAAFPDASSSTEAPPLPAQMAIIAIVDQIQTG